MLPGVQVHREPFPTTGRRPLAPLQRPQLIEGLSCLRTERLSDVALGEEEGCKDRFDALQIGLGLLARVGAEATEKRLLVRRRFRLAEPLPQRRAREQVRHARVAGDTGTVGRCGGLPRGPLAQSCIEVARRELRAPRGLECGDRTAANREGGKIENGGQVGNASVHWGVPPYAAILLDLVPPYQGYSHRNTLAETIVHTTHVRANATTSLPWLVHPSPCQMPLRSDVAAVRGRMRATP
jgi:hypothetical protein